jgi:DNA-binding transcriptional ArsR family regulator
MPRHKLKQMLQHQTLDRLFQALSDPSRRAIVDRLSRSDASVSELAKPLAMSLAAVVQHVQLLEASGLIRTRKTGRIRNCQLDRDALSQAESWLSQRRASWEDTLDRLGQVLAQQKTASARAATLGPPAEPLPPVARRRRKSA